MPRKQWRCFFCDEVFSRREDAAEHFGCNDSCEADVPACKIAAHESHLVKYIRKLENELRQRMHEDTGLHRAIYTLENELRREVQGAEEKGYDKGVADMKQQGYCTEPAAHDRVAVANADRIGLVEKERHW